MDVPQTMPEITSLCMGELSRKQWLVYYKNVWVRNLMARSIDVQTDIKLKAENPEEKVQSETGQEMPVKVRLELRKALVQDALDLIAGIDILMAMSDEELEATFSKEALAVAPDMIPQAPPVQGAECQIEGVDGQEPTVGRYEQTAPGKMVCIPNGKSIEDYLKEKVLADTENAKKETGIDNNEAGPVPAK